jgi:hypothetical protein
MRDLNLGPDSKKLVERYRDPTRNPGARNNVADQMALMLERWMEVAWCWQCASPVRICGGPHVKVRYDFDKTTEIIEPANKVGETFPDASYTIVNP